ncbi:MAG TPA: glycoside hydrolase family 76 protein [Streptosporangiaceae bacterium]|nr:glycoside hydrolase family 76 protein [Streptosporangiaceae bacterium]
MTTPMAGPAAAASPGQLAHLAALETAQNPASPATPSRQAGPRVDARRAVVTYQALQRNLYLPGYSLYPCDNTCFSGNRLGTLWPFSNAFAATGYLVGIRGVGRRFTGDIDARNRGLAAYYDPHETGPTGQQQLPAYASIAEPPLGPGGPTFYDDNAWVALDELYAYGLTRRTGDLRTAEGIFRFVVSGWDTSPATSCPGGVFWEDVAGSPRNTISNAPNAEAGLLIYLDTGQSYYLRWARKMYDWVRGCLRNPDGMYYDHINPDGTINTALWSYNQGTMIGAGALLYQATGNRGYLRQAEQTASASVSYYGGDGNLYHQPEVFDAIFFRNLWYLAGITHNPAYRQMTASYAETAWRQDRQATGLFSDPDPSGGEDLVNQTAPMVEIYALLAGSPPMIVSARGR